MARIFPFSPSPDDWQKLLADPEKHWRKGFSARTLAHCWTDADGFPPEIAAAFASASDPSLAGLSPVLGVPEFKVPLPGGERASQNDIFVLARSHSGPVSIMVEGKVEESFGPTLDEWLREASNGKTERLKFLLQKLGLPKQPDGTTRYQLLHRGASAVITGEQYRARAAVLLVHSFSKDRAGWADFEAFCGLFGAKPAVGRLERFPSEQAVPLFAVWVPGDQRFLVA